MGLPEVDLGVPEVDLVGCMAEAEAEAYQHLMARQGD